MAGDLQCGGHACMKAKQIGANGAFKRLHAVGRDIIALRVSTKSR